MATECDGTFRDESIAVYLVPDLRRQVFESENVSIENGLSRDGGPFSVD